MEPDNNVITYKKSLIKSIIKDFREIITQYGFKYRKDVLKRLRRTLRSYEKAANDEKEDDKEYLQYVINSLNSLIKACLNLKAYLKKKNTNHDHNTKYLGIEIIRYLFDKNENEDYYKPKLINSTFNYNYQEHQTDSDKKLLAPNEYLEKIRPNLIQLINNHKDNNNWKIQLTTQIIFNSIKNLNDKRILYVKTKNVEIMMESATNKTINELFDLLIQSCKNLSESFKKIMILP